MQQERLHVIRLPTNHFFRQIINDRPVTSGEASDELCDICTIADRQRRQL